MWQAALRYGVQYQLDMARALLDGTRNMLEGET